MCCVHTYMSLVYFVHMNVVYDVCMLLAMTCMCCVIGRNILSILSLLHLAHGIYVCIHTALSSLYTCFNTSFYTLVLLLLHVLFAHRGNVDQVSVDDPGTYVCM